MYALKALQLRLKRPVAADKSVADECGQQRVTQQLQLVEGRGQQQLNSSGKEWQHLCSSGSFGEGSLTAQ
ncbi:hypothetical protein CDL15_Pgr012870 [Punica granatum]|nr:hypothetical protein CDL15_Pgr012870 [Punica granatum]